MRKNIFLYQKDTDIRMVVFILYRYILLLLLTPYFINFMFVPSSYNSKVPYISSKLPFPFYFPFQVHVIFINKYVSHFIFLNSPTFVLIIIACTSLENIYLNKVLNREPIFVLKVLITAINHQKILKPVLTNGISYFKVLLL